MPRDNSPEGQVNRELSRKKEDNRKIGASAARHTVLVQGDPMAFGEGVVYDLSHRTETGQIWYGPKQVTHGNSIKP